MNIFLKIGEILFKIIGSIIILLVLILEYLSKKSKINKKECNDFENKENIRITPSKHIQTY